MKTISLILFLILFNLISNSQNKIELYKSNPDSLLQEYRDNNKLDSLHLLAHKAYKFFYKQRDFKKAIIYALVEVDLGRPFLSTKDYKNSLYNLGRFYYYDKQHYKSIECYKKVIDSFAVDRKTYQSYCETGRNYNILRDYYQSESYYKKGLSKPEFFKKSSLYNQYINYASVLDNIDTKKSLTEKLAILEIAENLVNSINLSPKKRFILNNSFAKYYKNDLTFNFKRASRYYHKNIQIALSEKDSSNLKTTYNNYGDLLNRINSDSAFYYLDKGIKLSNTKSHLLAKLYFNLAEHYSLEKQPLDAIKNMHNALISIPSIKIDGSYDSVIRITNALQSSDKALIWDILTDKAKYHIDYYQKTLDSNQAKLALKNLIIADKLIDAIRFESFESKSKLFWQDMASSTYMLGVKTAYILNDSEKAFYFMEKNKAILLLENISEQQIKKQINLPQEILKKEKRFKEKINSLELDLNQKNTNKDSIQNLYNNNKINYFSFIKSLEKSYPEFYNYKSQITIFSLSDTQKDIDKNSLFIEYILNKNNAYVIAITKNKVGFFEINSLSNLKNEVDKYLKTISKPFSQKQDLKNYTQTAKQLYKILLPFLKHQDYTNKKKLTIIPDYYLQNIPFESLLNPATNNYLLKDYEINYAYSMSFLNKNESLNRKASKSYIGFSPNTFNYDSLSELSNSNSEITNANNLFTGSIFLNNLATKNNFISKIKDYKIIHLSTHANANDSISPWIAFKNEKIYLNELYTTKNQAELVVLSACKTSLGTIKKGEGVFSLARGFFYSGANSVVSSLWNVNDKSTQKILSNFHKYLKKGETKGNALRLAKLEYLKAHSHSELSPYYWSSLVLIGNNSPINLSSSSYLYYLIAFLFLLIIVFYIKKKIIG